MGVIVSQITSLTIVYSNRLFRRRSKKTSKLRVTGLCAGNLPGTDEFPAQMTSNVEKVSIWWRHHEMHWQPMMTSSNGNIFRVTGLFVQGIHQSPVYFPHKGQRCGALTFFFDLHLIKWLNKQPWGWKCEMPSRSLWHHCNANGELSIRSGFSAESKYMGEI